MTKRITILALAAIATASLSAFASTEASAGWGKPGYGGRPHFPRPHIGHGHYPRPHVPHVHRPHYPQWNVARPYYRPYYRPHYRPLPTYTPPVQTYTPPVVQHCYTCEAPKPVYVPVQVPVRVEVPVPVRVEVPVPVKVPVYVPVKQAEPCDCVAPAPKPVYVPPPAAEPCDCEEPAYQGRPHTHPGHHQFDQGRQTTAANYASNELEKK